MESIGFGINYRQHQLLRRTVDEVSVLGERLKALRERQKFTQKTFADELGKALRANKEPGDKKKYTITQQQVHDWEAGNKSPNAVYLRHMAKILKVTSDYLTGVTNDPNSRLEEAPLSGPEKELVRAVRKAPQPVKDVTYRMHGIEPPPPELPANAESNDHLD